jgi:hypothetical protein
MSDGELTRLNVLLGGGIGFGSWLLLKLGELGLYYLNRLLCFGRENPSGPR